jgi:hypothetical protein
MPRLASQEMAELGTRLSLFLEGQDPEAALCDWNDELDDIPRRDCFAAQ